MSKTLSNGTLSLRFMQNALRAKNNAVTEVQKAPVKGEDEWHVPSSVREAWGITDGEASKGATYESSYVPFIFGPSIDAPDTAPKLKGRRKFDAGKEVAPAIQPIEEAMSVNRSQDTSMMESPENRSISASGFSNGFSNGSQTSANREKHASSAQGSQRKESKKPLSSNPGPSVLKMLSEEKGVGVDLKSATISRTREVSRTNTSGSTPAQSLGFLRPAGVDSPKDSSAAKISKRPHDQTNKDDRASAGAGEPVETVRKKKRKSNE